MTAPILDEPLFLGELGRWERFRARTYRRRHVLVLGLVLWLWMATFYQLGALRHDRFWTFGFDLGMFDQAIWLIAHGRSPFMTLRGLDVWGHHGNFLFVLLAPFYWFGAGAKFLLAVQIVAQASGAVGIYLLARDLLERSRWLAVGLATAMLLHPSMQFLVWEFFHPESFAIGPIVLAYWALRTNRRKTFWCMAVLAMACKEDVALLFVMLGLLWLAWQRGYRLGGLIAGVGAAWYVAVTKVLIPLRNPAGPFYEGHFFFNYGGSIGGVIKSMFTRPGQILRDATAGNRRELYIRLFAPVACVPLLAPEVVALGLPMLAVVVLAGIPWVQNYRYHYTAILVAVVFLATVEAVRRLRVPWRRNLAVSVVLLTSLLSTLAWGATPVSKSWKQGYWPHSRTENYVDVLLGATDSLDRFPTSLAKKHAVEMIPAGASVSASWNVNPHLTHRTHVYEWPNPWIGTNWGICNYDNLHDPATVEWIIIDRSYIEPDPYQVSLFERLLRSEFVIRREEAGVVTAERVRPPATPTSPAPTKCRPGG